ncbi:MULTISPECIES: GNAT family N-acetyltransferase [Alkalibacillus]|uniref:GNAT family N-acetyltransferase n=1 Tax=Alkalibacillus silvisoli TaxID=392823 RepID=A0ABN0ZUJ3_9BACI|nr:GNAT family N-acetyltransferase [Alkalibacillus haloalkaliphilus]
MKIRKADNTDCNRLSTIAYNSKSYWGYSQDFLDKCKEDLTVTVEYIKNNPTYVMIEGKEIVAFYSFSLSNEQLDALFIDPVYIGKGFGQLLWIDLMKRVKELGVKQFTIDSDPGAEGFYLKMGAEKVGYTPSTVFPQRSLPLLKVKVT